MILLAVFVWLIALLAFVLPWRRKQDNVNADELEETQTMSQVLVQASRHSGFWLLFAGFLCAASTWRSSPRTCPPTWPTTDWRLR
ncbi:MAG: hypothetical protein R2856_19310 [Caldilineaceae bacterium]